MNKEMIDDLSTVIKWLKNPPTSVKHGYHGHDCPLTGDHFSTTGNIATIVLANLKKKWTGTAQEVEKPSVSPIVASPCQSP